MADSRDNLLAVSGNITTTIRNNAVARAAQFIYGSVQGPSSDKTNPFATGAYIEQVNGEDDDRLWLAHWPVTAVSAITDETGTSLGLIIGTSGTVSLTADVWIVDSIAHGVYKGHLLKPNGTWTEGKLNYIVSYTAGFDLASYIPQGLKDAINMIALDLLQNDDYARAKSMQIKSMSITYEENNGAIIPTRAAELLRPFCRYRL